jgi:20S proteasome subunit alpha 6
MQVPDVHPTCKPLEAHPSSASTVLEFDTQETVALSDDGVATVNGDEDSSIQDKLPAGDEPEHISEPPRSPTPNNVPSLVNGESSTAAAKDAKTPSANRLSISYAGGNKRLVINAEVVETLKVFRHEGRIEVSVMVDKAGEDGLKGILVNSLDIHLREYWLIFVRSKAYQIRQNPIYLFKSCPPHSNMIPLYHHSPRSPSPQQCL